MSRALLLALAASLTGFADEGMWTFDNLPLAKIQARFGFTPSEAWVDHLRLSSLRFPGGSASFVSSEGLVLTNHHVVRGLIQRLSTRERDLLKDGFTALSRDQELRVPGLEVMQLVRLENITAQVAAAAKGVKDPSEALRARQRETARAHEALRIQTGLTVEPVLLYQGGETWLYVYRKFTDVRLVVAPELSVARFGGDHDNFTFPRHHLDFALLRVYQEGKPFRPEHFLRWSPSGLKPGEASFISGHPGTTRRLFTLAQMEAERDTFSPLGIQAAERRRAYLEAFAQRSFEARTQVGGMIYGIDNGLKAQRGYLASLRNLEAMAKVAKAEADLRARVMKDPALRAEAGASWEGIRKALAARKRMALELQLMDNRGSEVLGTALHLLRLPTEVAKPEAKRLSEYAEAGLGELKTRLGRTRPVPFNPDLETHLLASGMQEALDLLGSKHPYVKALLGGKAPLEVAKAVVAGTRLQDPSEVRRLLEGGATAMASCQDPMVALARRLDPLQRALREQREKLVEGPLREHGDRIARARFALYGKLTYPDATFTLRLTYGAVETYPANGTLVQPFTTLGGLFDRFVGWGGTTHNLQRDTWRLPQRWLDRRSVLDPDTPYNFASSHDIIGGNSGSPVVDAKGELVGLAFDGNLESLGGPYYYDGRTNRTVSVDIRAIREVLAKVLEGAAILKELN